MGPVRISTYALNSEHPFGKHKALVFESTLGFKKEHAELLKERILKNLAGQKIVAGTVDSYGMRFSIDMVIEGINGKCASVKTAWIIKQGSDIPTLISAYVNKKN